MSSQVHLLKKELQKQSISQQIFLHQRDHQLKTAAADKIKRENKVKENKSRIAIVHERRRAATLENKRKLFLRQEKSGEKLKKEKRLNQKKAKAQDADKYEEGSFKSNLERAYQRQSKVDAQQQQRKDAQRQMFAKHRLSKTISKIVMKR